MKCVHIEAAAHYDEIRKEKRIGGDSARHCMRYPRGAYLCQSYFRRFESIAENDIHTQVLSLAQKHGVRQLEFSKWEQNAGRGDQAEDLCDSKFFGAAPNADAARQQRNRHHFRA